MVMFQPVSVNGSRVDFAAVKAASVGAVESLVRQWLPHGKKVGHEWSATNPTRGDTKPGSFKINLRTGVWSDFATGEKGGDMIDLLSYMHGLQPLDAAREIGDLLGLAQKRTAEIHLLPKGNRTPTVLAPAAILADPDTFPPRTPPDGEGKPRFLVAGDEGTKVWPEELRRHAYRVGSTPVRIKVMRRGKDSRAMNWYRVADGNVTGWQAKKPDGYRDVPFIGALDPFDPAHADQDICWPEGEKDVESLARKGLFAFTFGGVGDGLPVGCEEYVRGRNVVIFADNDAEGRQHAEAKAALAAPIAASVKIIDFLDLPEKGDVSDWFSLGADHSAERLRWIIDNTEVFRPIVQEADTSEDTGEDDITLPIFSAASLHGKQVPELVWHVPDIVPGRNVTLLQGDGATGKSLLALMLAASTVLGAPWVGLDGIEHGPAIFLSAEDEMPILHRRLAGIAQHMNVSLQDLADLHLVPLAGEDAVLAAPVNRSNIIGPTKLWEAVQKCVAEIRPRLVVLDTLADLFAGEENQRAQARQFISMLRGLALANDLCIVLLGHPSLEGLKSGSGTSGSTGWNNSVRSRLYFERVFTSEGNKVIEQDEDVRELSVKKVNYGRKGEPIRVKWIDGVFERQAGTTFGLDATQRNAVADDAFLTLLRLHERLGMPVSPNPSSLYAPTVFTNHSQSGGISKRAFKGAMERLLEAQKIRAVHEGPPSKRRVRLTVYAEEEA